MPTPPCPTVSVSAPTPPLPASRQRTSDHPPNAGRPHSAPRRMVFLLAFACALTVANLYYCQTLLPEIAKSFSASQSSTGGLVTATQLGYGVALLLIVPLGDITNRRRLVCGLLIIEAVAMAAAAAAPNLALLLVAGAAVGIAACVVQILVPYAATIAADHERGRVTGTVLSGLLIGILLSRTVAGLIGQAFGWRTVFATGGVLMLLLSAVLARAMQSGGPEVAIGYREQLRATARLARTEPVLRRRAVMGGLMFAAFGAFWATVSFLLAGSPYRYNQATIGLFALVGAAGALAARLTGHAADRGRERATSGSLLVLGLGSFGAIALGSATLAWLLAGVVLMDAAVQGVNTLNLSVVYSLSNGARARIASVYMTTYFVLGALGSAAGTEAYHYGGWAGVSAVGGGCVALALLVWFRDSIAARHSRRDHVR